MNKMFVLLVVVMVAGLSACGSSSGSSTCSFVFSDFTNGANATVTENVWNCASAGSSFTFAFYDDKTGYSSAIGAFTWSEVACQSVDAVASNGTNHITNAAGSITSGIGSFTQTTPTGSVLTVACTLGSLSVSAANSLSKADAEFPLSLHSSCESNSLAETLNLTALESNLWSLRDLDNAVQSVFVSEYPFNLYGAECNLSNSGIICKADNCSFEYK